MRGDASEPRQVDRDLAAPGVEGSIVEVAIGALAAHDQFERLIAPCRSVQDQRHQ